MGDPPERCPFHLNLCGVGILLSFGVALLESVKDTVGKVATRETSPVSLLFLYKGTALLVLLPLLLWRGAHADLSIFLPVAALNASLNALAFYLYLKAISLSPLSVTVPVLSFSPVFLLFTSRIMLGQEVPPLGAAGVLLVALGSYVLNLGEAKGGLFRPVLALLREPGPKYMLTVALLWSVTANLDRVGVEASDPVLWVVSMNVGIALFTLPFAVGGLRRRRVSPFHPLAMGVADAVGSVLQMLAITLTLVPYVIAVKRTSTLLSSLVGVLLFHEGRWKERLAGATVMSLGASLILLSLFGG